MKTINIREKNENGKRLYTEVEQNTAETIVTSIVGGCFGVLSIAVIYDYLKQILES